MVTNRFVVPSPTPRPACRLPGLRRSVATGLLPANGLLAKALLFLLMLLFATGASAEDSLEASVDRNTIHENETLTLTLKGRTGLELSLDALMNLQNLELPEPDLDALRDSFDILDQRQSYSLSSVNGEHSAEVTWTYQLAPRDSGNLTIPPLTFGTAQSEPMAVEVKPGSPSQASSQGRAAWIEAEVSKDEVFVQEQLVYTLRLYYRGTLVGGDLSEPQVQDAIIEPLGDQSQTSTYLDGRRYQVVERRYLVYPQRTGELVLPSQRFTGRQRDPATGALRFLRAQSPPKTVAVLPPPEDFPGDRWIPAESLFLDEEWSQSPDELRVGDSLTRVVTLRTLGLLESALPRISVDYPEQLNAYPEAPDAEAEINAGTVEATQSQTTALVAVKPGQATIPEIRLHWWDTLNDQARVAVLPARTLTVLPAPGTDPGSAAPAPTQTEPEPEPEVRDMPGDLGTQVPPATESGTSSDWMAVLAAFFAAAWLVTLALWLRKRPAKSENLVDPDESGQFDLTALKQHATEGRTETFREIPAWVRARFGRGDIRTLRDTRAFFDDPELNETLDALEEHHFGAAGRQEWTQGKKLAAVLERLNRLPGANRSRPGALPPFRKLPE